MESINFTLTRPAQLVKLKKGLLFCPNTLTLRLTACDKLEPDATCLISNIPDAPYVNVVSPVGLPTVAKPDTPGFAA